MENAKISQEFRNSKDLRKLYLNIKAKYHVTGGAGDRATDEGEAEWGSRSGI